MACIKQCNKCGNMEFDWWPVFEQAEEVLRAYSCTKCVDHTNKINNNIWFMASHGMHIPPTVFGFIYPMDRQQWIFLNRCQRSQRIENLRHLLLGAPYNQNDIYNLHCQLEGQIRRGYQWKGNAYRTTCWDHSTDLIEFQNGFLN